VSGEPVFGPIVSGGAVRAAVLDTVRLWLPAYLAEVERQRGHTPGALGQPRSWRRPPDIWKVADQQSPAVMVLPPVWNGQPDREGGTRGSVQASWRVAVAVVVNVGGGDPDWSGEVAADYCAALWALLEQQGSLGGVAADTRCVDLDTALLTQADQRQRALAAGSVSAIVMTRDSLRRREGPVEVPADPYEDPGVWPVVETANVTVDKE